MSFGKWLFLAWQPYSIFFNTGAAPWSPGGSAACLELSLQGQPQTPAASYLGSVGCCSVKLGFCLDPATRQASTK